MGTILFTGRRIEQLSRELVESMDMIVDGPYDQELRDEERNLVSSSNQTIHDISGRYRDRMGWFLDKRGPRVEVSLLRGGNQVTGDVLRD